MSKVIFVCHTCGEWNKHVWVSTAESGERKNTEFESLTEAYEHLLQGHWVATEIRDEG